LKTRDLANRDFWKSSFSATQTQKSFSMIVGRMPSRAAASLKMSFDPPPATAPVYPLAPSLAIS
jgi:hypothetical protein